MREGIGIQIDDCFSFSPYIVWGTCFYASLLLIFLEPGSCKQDCGFSSETQASQVAEVGSVTDIAKATWMALPLPRYQKLLLNNWPAVTLPIPGKHKIHVEMK